MTRPRWGCSVLYPPEWNVRWLSNSETASSAEHPHTVLIVEDEVLTRIVLAQHLRDCGYRVLEAGNAAEAIMVLESDFVVDILFTDVNLPGDMNGFALGRWTRKRRPQTRTILTSGTERAAQKASDLCDDEPYLLKPYDPAALVREIRRLLETRRSGPGEK